MVYFGRVSRITAPRNLLIETHPEKSKYQRIELARRSSWELVRVERVVVWQVRLHATLVEEVARDLMLPSRWHPRCVSYSAGYARFRPESHPVDTLELPHHLMPKRLKIMFERNRHSSIHARTDPIFEAPPAALPL